MKEVSFSTTTDNFGRITIVNPCLTAEFVSSFEQTVQTAAASGVTAVIVTVTGKNYPAAYDVELLLSDEEEVATLSARFSSSLRVLEMSVPLLATMPNDVQGIGLEIVLTAHARLALPEVRVGFPEVNYGLMPAHGAMQRLARLVGIEASLMFLTSGKTTTAKAAGLCRTIVETQEELLPRAKALATQLGEKAYQPWDQHATFRWPTASPESFAITKMWMATPAAIFKKTGGHYPVYDTIASCIYEGVQLDFEVALANDLEQWRCLLRHRATRNIIRVQGIVRPQIMQRASATKAAAAETVGIIGAGMMGAGIAVVSALSGCRVLVIDREAKLAAAAVQRAENYLQRQQESKKITAEQAQAVLARLECTTEPEQFADCNLVIEAVYEDRGVKKEMINRIEPLLPDNAVFASNTSTLPISSLASYSTRPQNFIGLHFFSPVEKMQLVEIIKGKETTQAAIDFSFAYVAKLQKVPILVNDARSFYTSRVFMTYLCEGMSLLRAGHDAVTIEYAGRKAGMPVPPLALTDEISLSLVQQIFAQTERDGATVPAAAQEVISTMLEKHERSGRKSGRGFYDYHEKGKQLWSGVHKLYPSASEPLSVEVMAQRLLNVQAEEAQRCLDEGVVQSIEDANIGSILGWGFPLFHGGVLQYRQDEQADRRLVKQ